MTLLERRLKLLPSGMSRNWKGYPCRKFCFEMFTRVRATNMKICYCFFKILLRNSEYSKFDNFMKFSGIKNPWFLTKRNVCMLDVCISLFLVFQGCKLKTSKFFSIRPYFTKILQLKHNFSC